RAIAEPDGFADHGRIAVEYRRPETIGQHRRALGLRAVVSRVEQPSQHGPQTHHLEIRSADDARADLTRLAEADHCETDGREVAERAQRLDSLAQILDFRHGESDAVGA